MWSAIKQGNEWKGEILNKRKNGSLYWASISIFPVKDEVGNVIKYIAIEEDITRRKEVEEDLKKALVALEKSNKNLKELDKTKNEFLGIATHDLRGPLNSIAQMAELLIEGELSKEQINKFYKIIERTSSNMLKLIDDLLDVTKIKSGSVNLNIKEINIKNYIKELLSSYELLAKRKNITLSYKIEDKIKKQDLMKKKFHK